MTTNPFTAEAAESAAAASAFKGSVSPERHRLLVEAVGFATVGNAIDTAELLAMQRVDSMERAMLHYGLVPAEDGLNLEGIDDAGRELITAILAALRDPESTTQIAVYDATTYVTDRIALAARVLDIDEERLAAFYGAEAELIVTSETPEFDAFAEARENDKPAKGKGKKAKGQAS
jgi:hypothetical protein